MSTLNLKNLSSGVTTEFELNEPQALARMVNANTTVLLWGRGTGKTVGGIAPWIIDIVNEMPGCLVGIFGKTHEQLGKNILPKILLGLSMLRYKEDIDYVIGKKPPAHWPKCVYPGIKKWDKTFTWKNGTVFQNVSLFEKGDANAFDFQAALFDEAKYCDHKQLEDEVYPTLRGFEDKFGNSHLYLARLYATDKLYDFLQIQWLLNFRLRVNHDDVSKVLKMEYLISELIQKYNDANAAQKRMIETTIRKLKQKGNKIRQNLVYVSEASAVDNIQNLGPKWILNKKQNMTPYKFNVAILNKDPDQNETNFYHALNDKNYYLPQFENADFDVSKPVIIALDYQHSVAPLLVAQVNNKVHNKSQLNFICEFDTVYPHGLTECIALFAQYYKPLGVNKVYYVYDQTAKGMRAGADQLYKIVIKSLKSHGIAVREVYMGEAPQHFDKYVQINEAFMGNKFLQIGINKSKIVNAKLSLENAGTKLVNGVTKKNKELENAGKYPSIDQRHTTHYSDVFDQIVWAVIEQKLIKFQARAGGVRTS